MPPAAAPPRVPIPAPSSRVVNGVEQPATKIIRTKIAILYFILPPIVELEN